MQILFTPYFLEKYKPDYHSIKREGWNDNLDNSLASEPKEVITRLNLQVAEFVQNSALRKEPPVCIGGDCIKPLGVIKGLTNYGIEPALLWLDAHGDFNTSQTSPSGFIGGMPLAILTGREDPFLLAGHKLAPLPDEKIIIYDRRNLDPAEAALLAESKVRQPENMESLEMECLKENKIYLHFDADIINPVDAPAMLFRTPGGPRLSELKTFINKIKEKIVAVSVTLWEPSLDSNKQTEKAVFEIIDLFN